MNYGLYLSASGVLTSMYRQDVFANNLANVGTVGFKRDLAMVSQRAPESIEGDHPFELQHALLDRLGGGVFAGPQSVAFKAGALERTNNPRDIALEGDNAFLAVSASNPATGRDEVHLTRDGRLSVNGGGYLVMMAGGQRVLDEDDQPIRLGDAKAEVTIDRDGRVRQDGAVVAQLQIAAAANPKALVKAGGNLLRFEDGRDGRVEPAQRRVRPGFVEASTADPFTELKAMLDASSAVEANGNLIRYHDLLMDRAVNTLGRVTA